MKKIIINMVLFLLINCTNQTESSRSFIFNYEVNIKPTNDKLELWIPLPQSSAVQVITNLSIDSDGLEYIVKDELNHDNKYLYIFSNEGIDKETTIILSFDVKRIEHQNMVYNNIDPNKYLNSYTTVPTGMIFNAIIKKNDLSKSDIKKTYDYVLSGMHYGKPKSIDDKYYKDPWLTKNGKYGIRKVDRDMVVSMYQRAKKEDGNFTFGNGNSLYACNIGVGNCTDYHSYFMSLGRTMDIPVRFHMGFSIPNDVEGTIDGYHCWADYYVESEGWYPVDISEADKNIEKKDYYFGTVDNNRVEMMVGRDFELDQYDQGIVNLFIYPLMELNDKKSNAFTKRFSYENY